MACGVALPERLSPSGDLSHERALAILGQLVRALKTRYDAHRGSCVTTSPGQGETGASDLRGV